MMAAKKSINLMEQALDSVIDHGKYHYESSDLPANATRIDYLPAELVRPDPVQARRVLPEAIHFAFHEQRLTPVQALHELIRSAQLAARQHGRSFTNVVDLLSDLTTETTEETDSSTYTPEESLVRDLVTLATTIRDDGQVNPLTVMDVSQGVMRLFRIETGERRYWASWLLREFLPSYTGDGTIPCVVVQNTPSTVFRQARENIARAGLSAIAMARQAALLLMVAHDIPKPDYAVTNDFYRQAATLDLLQKREFSEEILTAMGGISRSRFSRIKALLNLSDEALEIADRHQIDEWRLRYVLALPEQDQAEMVKQIVQLNLSGRQVKAICEHQESEQPDPPDEGSKPAIRLAGIIRTSQALSGQAFAQALFNQDKDWNIVRARLQTLKQLVTDTEQFIENR